MKYFCLASLLLLLSVSVNAQTTRDSSHLVPTGKGWGQRLPPLGPPHQFVPPRATTNGIYYHGGPVIPGNVNLYFIWYGNFVNGPGPSDSILTQNLLTTLFSNGGLGGSPYARINSTYSDPYRKVTGNFALAESANDYYSRGTKLSDNSVAGIVSSAIVSRVLPRDPNGLYFLLTSSDVTETSG